MSEGKVRDVLEFVSRLRAAKIWCRLEANRYDGITVTAVVPGEIWEIDFLEDGAVDVEIFKSDGMLYGRDKIEELFERFSD